MTKYSKSSDQMIEIVDSHGKKIRVTERAYNIVYAGRGYKPASAAGESPNKQPDYSTFTQAELKKVKNDDLKSYLDFKGISYASDAIKEDYIKLILGE